MLRSMLFAPGNHPRRVEKALECAADAVILDLEDACPIAGKVDARAAVANALGRPRAGRLYVRINDLSTDYAHGDLLAVVRPGLDGIMLPKTSGPDQLRTVDWLLTQLERERLLPVGGVDLIPLVETAQGMAGVQALASATSRVRRLAFGAGDFTVELDMQWSRDELELLPHRSALVLASRAAGLEPPLDSPWITLADGDGFRASASRGRSLGFQGKLCIHPEQVSFVNGAFTPSAAEVARAQRLMEAFREAESRGSAAIQLDGQLVDYALVAQARRVVDFVRQQGTAEP